MAKHPNETHGVHILRCRELGNVGADERFGLQRSTLHGAGHKVEEFKFVLPTVHKPAHQLEEEHDWEGKSGVLGREGVCNSPHLHSQCRKNSMLGLLHNYSREVDHTADLGSHWRVCQLKDEV